MPTSFACSGHKCRNKVKQEGARCRMHDGSARGDYSRLIGGNTLKIGLGRPSWEEEERLALKRLDTRIPIPGKQNG